MEDLDAWRALLVAQHGIVTRRQALEHGLTLGMIRAHVAAERWRRLRYGVIATFTGPLTPEAAEWAAVLACWPAALSHESAGRRYRMARPRAGAPMHVTVRYGASTSRHDDLVVHRSRAFDHITAPPDGGPPIVAAVHTAVDLAIAAPTARSAMSVLQRCALSGGVSGAQLLAALDLRRPPRYRDALHDAAMLMVEGVMSALESTYVLEVESAHGLPGGVRQVPVVVDGTVLFEDILYSGPGGELVVRLDGWRFHSDRRVAHRDRRRGNAAELAGRARLVYGPEEVEGEPCRTAREIATVLTTLGRTEGLRPCVRCGSL
jgi:hypothetical protein